MIESLKSGVQEELNLKIKSRTVITMISNTMYKITVFS